MIPALAIPSPVVPNQIHIQVVSCHLGLAPLQLLHRPVTHEERSCACMQCQGCEQGSRESRIQIYRCYSMNCFNALAVEEIFLLMLKPRKHRGRFSCAVPDIIHKQTCLRSHRNAHTRRWHTESLTEARCRSSAKTTTQRCASPCQIPSRQVLAQF